MPEASLLAALCLVLKIRLGYLPRANIPSYLAGRGDLTVKLAGEAADGFVISNMCSVEFAGRAAELMHASARAARRETRPPAP